MRIKAIVQKLKADRRSRWTLRTLYFLLFFAVFGDFIANEKPIYCKIDGERYLPMLKAPLVGLGLGSWDEQIASGRWTDYTYESVVYTMIPYSANSVDSKNGNFRSPFGPQDVAHWRFRHWLGTDAVGRDVTAGLIRGCRIAIVVGLGSMLIAVFIGVPIGASAGYFGDTRMKGRIGTIGLWVLLGLLVIWCLWQAGLLISSYGLTSRSLGFILTAFIMAILTLVGSSLLERKEVGRRVGVPVDFIVMRAVEIMRSIPAFFLLFALLGIVASASLVYVVLLIALLRIPTMIRYVRAEAQKIRDLPYIDAARVIGLVDRQVISRHIIPNAIGPVMITAAFGIGGAILLESGLSFLGIGLGIDQLSWGRLLSEARSNFAAWWLAVLPGVAIFLTVATFNRVGEVLTEYFEVVEESL